MAREQKKKNAKNIADSSGTIRRNVHKAKQIFRQIDHPIAY